MATTLQQRFEEAKERALAQVEEYISSQYQGQEQESIDFRFDAFSMWGAIGVSDVFWKGFPVERFTTDPWLRSVWSLNKAEAMAIAKYVETWNGEWEYSLTGDMRDFNAYRVAFSAATGSEHEISVSTGGQYTADSWRWK